MEQLVINDSDPFYILSLDGGGSKGIYTIGILKEVEKLISKPLHKHFNLVFGTSTGAIITALIGLGYSAQEIENLYLKIIPDVMGHRKRAGRSKALNHYAKSIFGDRRFEDFLTYIGIVATHSEYKRPMIFKSSISQAHGRKSSFLPGFGAKISDAVIASCAAFPYFDKPQVETLNQGYPELLDGGFVANNPSLFAIADATKSLNIPTERLRLLSLGVGNYPEKNHNFFLRLVKKIWIIDLLETTLTANTNTIDIVRKILFSDVKTVRVSDSYADPKYATNLLENDLSMLRKLRELGRESFGNQEEKIKFLFSL